MNNEIYVRRKQKIFLPVRKQNQQDVVDIVLLASFLKNIEKLGAMFSLPLIEDLKQRSSAEIINLNKELLNSLKRGLGAHVFYRPMYPNFPSQVMNMNTATLYFNAILHYLTAGQWLPETTKLQNKKLLEPIQPRIINLGSEQEFLQLFINLMSAKTSLSETDKKDLEWFFYHYPKALNYLPDEIPHKENMAYICSLIINRNQTINEVFIEPYIKTATDVLRIAVALSDGDISLATSTKFSKFKRPIRRFLLSLLESCDNLAEDMKRYKKRWIRLGEILHPKEYKAFSKSNDAFYKLRNEVAIDTFNSKVEQQLNNNDVYQALLLLKTRPGELARRLDYLLRLDRAQQDVVITQFKEVAKDISSTVLLQVREHFKTRNHNPSDIRIFFPKGEVAKAFSILNELPLLDEELCLRVVDICEHALLEIYQKRKPLGKVYINPAYQHYVVPFSQRSASKTLKTIARGSKLSIDENATILRAFLWWKNGKERTDLDLSAVILDNQWNYKTHISFTNLKSTKYNAVYSGDIVDAPNGASEFIDLDICSMLEYQARYVVVTVHSYTSQPYCDLPECFAGWMTRKNLGSGEIYEPKTVQNKFDLTANTEIAIPYIIDLKDRKVIWADMSLTRYPNWHNTVEGNLKGIVLACRAITEMVKPNLYDLVYLNALARGQICTSKSEADTIFDINEGITPLDIDTFMCDFI